MAYSWDECRLNQFILLKCLLCWSFDECASKFAKQTDISADKVDQEVRREHKGSKIISFSIDLRGTVSSPRTSILRSTSLQYYFREFRLQGHNGVASKAHTRTQPFGHFLSPTTTLDYCKQYSWQWVCSANRTNKGCMRVWLSPTTLFRCWVIYCLANLKCGLYDVLLGVRVRGKGFGPETTSLSNLWPLRGITVVPVGRLLQPRREKRCIFSVL